MKINDYIKNNIPENIFQYNKYFYHLLDLDTVNNKSLGLKFNPTKNEYIYLVTINNIESSFQNFKTAYKKYYSNV